MKAGILSRPVEISLTKGKYFALKSAAIVAAIVSILAIIVGCLALASNWLEIYADAPDTNQFLMLHHLFQYLKKTRSRK